MASAEVKRWEARLLDDLGPRVHEYGFSNKAIGQSFHRMTEAGRQTLHIAFIEHEDDFDVTADVAIRVDVLEKMVNSDNKQLTAFEKSDKASFGAELGNLEAGKQRRWSITSESEIPEVADSIIAALRNIGLPYLERYSDLRLMLETLAKNDRGAWLHAPVHESRCKRILALAVITGQVAKLPGFAQQCEDFLRKRSDPGLPSFQAYANRLLEQHRHH